MTEGRKDASPSSKLTKEQDALLVAEGFEPAGGGFLWRRDGVYFGREAALQNAQSRLLQRDGYALYDLTARGPTGTE